MEEYVDPEYAVGIVSEEKRNVEYTFENTFRNGETPARRLC